MLTLPVRQHFGFTRDPFTNELRSLDEVFTDSPVHRAIEDAMLDAAKFQGFAAAICPVGFGKTIIRRKIFETLKQRGYKICTVEQLDRERLTIDSIQEAMLLEWGGKAHAGKSRERRTRELKKMLEMLRDQGHECVLMIDEGHALHSSTLRGLKRLYEIESGLSKLLAILIFGQMQLYSRLGHYDIEEVSERLQVVMAYGLDSPARQGVSGPEPKRSKKSSVPAYIDHKLRCAGVKEPDKLITADAKKLIAKVTDVPLRIHNILIRALNFAYEINESRVAVEVLEQMNVREEE